MSKKKGTRHWDFRSLLKAWKWSKSGMTDAEIGKKVGRSRGGIRQALKNVQLISEGKEPFQQIGPAHKKVANRIKKGDLRLFTKKGKPVTSSETPEPVSSETKKEPLTTAGELADYIDSVGRTLANFATQLVDETAGDLKKRVIELQAENTRMGKELEELKTLKTTLKKENVRSTLEDRLNSLRVKYRTI
jgi:hypothetical protein